MIRSDKKKHFAGLGRGPVLGVVVVVFVATRIIEIQNRKSTFSLNFKLI